jgi:hypothetical protein
MKTEVAVADSPEVMGITTRAPHIPDDVLKLKLQRPFYRKLAYEKTVPFTKAIAGKYLHMVPFVGERSLRDKWIVLLIRLAKAGRFVGEEATLISCECGWDGVERRINGQHTCHMRLYMPENWNVPIRVRRYRVNTEEEFRLLYAIVDGGKGKVPADVVAAMLYGTEEYSGLKRKQLTNLSSGIRIWKSTTVDKGQNIHDTVDDMRNGMMDLSLRVDKFLRNVCKENAPHMQNAAIVAAIMATFEKSERAAREFWTIVRDGGARADHPAQKLMKHLMSVKIYTSNSTNTSKSKRPTSRELIYRACIMAWNAHRTGESVSLKRLPKARVAVK